MYKMTLKYKNTCYSQARDFQASLGYIQKLSQEKRRVGVGRKTIVVAQQLGGLTALGED